MRKEEQGKGQKGGRDNSPGPPPRRRPSPGADISARTWKAPQVQMTNFLESSTRKESG